MRLQPLDWVVVGSFLAFTLAVGMAVARRAGRSSADFFLSGRTQPWWLLGTSMVATTFAADTPLLVTSIVREQGVAGNWVWWAFLLTGMVTAAVYAKLWRRTGVVTDVEFYELRYGGPPAAFLRGFRAFYLGLVFNVLVMANVTLAAVKIGSVMFGFSAVETILVATVATVVFSTAGGLTSVLVTDFVLFIVAMVGSVAAAVVALGVPEVGGIAGLMSHPVVRDKAGMWPALDFSTTAGRDLAMTMFIIPLAVQWWAAWYPGAEPGGGGYVAQRMLAARDERHATGATLLFNFAHYALRPWPWILVALASLVVFPDETALRAALPAVDPTLVGDDLAYPAMLTRLPAGLLGLVAASLAAAYMSTISTQLNWGASYVANDIWLRFVRPGAPERELVAVGRVMTVALMALAAFIALRLESVYEGFRVLLTVGAGTGLIYILRWFWWRVNASAEIVAMAVSFALAAGFFVAGKTPGMAVPPEWQQFLWIVGVTTVAWLAAALFGPAESQATLEKFVERARPGGPGWRAVIDRAHAAGRLTDLDARWKLPVELVFAVAGCVAIYGGLFATGYLIYGDSRGLAMALAATAVGILVAGLTFRRAVG